MNKKIITAIIIVLASITLCACSVTPQGDATRNEPGRAVEDTQRNVSKADSSVEDEQDKIHWWIKEYVADTMNNKVVHTDVYGSLCSLKTSS